MLNYYQNKTIKYSQSSTGKTCSPLLCYRKTNRTNSCGNAIANSQGLLHAETGFSYFGARYYDSDILTGWLSVDPLADSLKKIFGVIQREIYNKIYMLYERNIFYNEMSIQKK